MAIAGTLTGTAQNGKASAVVLSPTGEVTHVVGLDAWPADVVGQEVRLTGELDEASSQGATGLRRVIRDATWAPTAHVKARDAGHAEPGPWRVVYTDGSGNTTTIWTQGARVQWTYRPITPAESSSGTYSGGEPAEGSVALADTASLWHALRAAEADPGLHTETRTMGSHQIAITRIDGSTRFILRRGGKIAETMSALRVGE